MSGHITRMSRGSSVGSSSRRPSSTSRSTSTWRAAPWQLCTCTDRSAGVERRPAGRTALARRSDCSQPSIVSGAVGLTVVVVGRVDGGEAALAARGRRGPGWPAAGGRPAVAEVVGAARPEPRSPAQRPPQVVARVREPQVQVVVGRERGQQRRSRCWASGCGRRARAASGRSLGPASQAGDGLGVPHVRRGLRRPASTRARHSGGCQRRSAASSPPAPSVTRPSSQSTSSCGRWTAYDAKSPASRRATE